MVSNKQLFTPILLMSLTILFNYAEGQNLTWQGIDFEIVSIKASVTLLNGQEVLRVEKDLEAVPYNAENPVSSVDEPTFLKVSNLSIDNGVIEVKVLARLLETAPPFARGFIGLAYRINDNNSAYESIYLRPANGRVDDQIRRNHTIQYYSYPDYKFARLREPEYLGQYETYGDIGLDEWITLRIEFQGKTARLYLNGQEYPSFIVNGMLGKSQSGSIGLWVDIGTEGFFKDLKVTGF